MSPKRTYIREAYIREGEAPAEPLRTSRDGGAPAEPFPIIREGEASTEPPLSRKHPAHGVFLTGDHPVIVYLTVCTKDRVPWLATQPIHALLRQVWLEATAWLVGRYVIMPDHIHLFAGLGEIKPAQQNVARRPLPLQVPLDNWVQFWKSQFSKQHRNRSDRWQTDHWDTRLRDNDRYEEKWEYVRNNPVRKGLVASPDEWPFQGELFELRWD